MIPRRVYEHVKAHNWFAVAIDFAIVVVGVFVGIQVSNWNEARGERERERLLLARLEADFEVIAESVDRTIRRHIEMAQAAQRVIQVVQSSDDAPTDEMAFRDDLDETLQGTPPVQQSPTFVELLAGGQMYLIRDEALRAALAEFDQAVQNSARVFEALVDLNVRYGEALGRKIVYSEAISPAGVVEELTVGAYDLSAMRADPELVPSLSMVRRTHAYSLFWAQDLKRRADEARSRLAQQAAGQP
jgi:hypothetical protein